MCLFQNQKEFKNIFLPVEMSFKSKETEKIRQNRSGSKYVI